MLTNIPSKHSTMCVYLYVFNVYTYIGSTLFLAMPSRRRMRGGKVSVTEHNALFSPKKKSASASPSKRSASPSKRSASPSKKSASPSKRSASPTKSPSKRSASPRKSPKEIVAKMGSLFKDTTESIARTSAKSIVENGKNVEHAVNTSLTKIGQLPGVKQVKDATTKAASSATSIVKGTAVGALRKTADAISGGSRRRSKRRKSKSGKRRKSRSGKRRKSRSGKRRKTKRASKKSKRIKRSRRKTKRNRRRTRRGGSTFNALKNTVGNTVHDLGNVGSKGVNRLKRMLPV